MCADVHVCAQGLPARPLSGVPFVVALRCPGMRVGIGGVGVMVIKGKVKV